ncbi:MAG: SAM-dependent DNA methyltransferase, partial [Chloroflexi bacterium]
TLDKILAEADREYQDYKTEVAGYKLPEEKQAELLRKKYAEIQAALDQKKKGSRLWKLANRCIYGTDANDRMARTSKMNMIMHGDGHGGVHHHDGFINVNGIFEERFDIVLTNPPFGANVELGDVVQEAEVQTSEELRQRYVAEYGAVYEAGQKKVETAKGKPIASLFDLPKNATSKIKTEILFIERCLNLLKPGGRMGIVLPEGVFNNPSLAYVREFCEERAFIRAVVSLPQETFYSSGASVKASLLFLQKFTLEEKAAFESQRAAALTETWAAYAGQISAEKERLNEAIKAAKRPGGGENLKALQKELAEYSKNMDAQVLREARVRFKERVDYPVFMYDAEHVGISATGEADYNELYPNDNPPPDMDKTALDWCQQFVSDPLSIVAGE